MERERSRSKNGRGESPLCFGDLFASESLYIQGRQFKSELAKELQAWKPLAPLSVSINASCSCALEIRERSPALPSFVSSFHTLSLLTLPPPPFCKISPLQRGWPRHLRISSSCGPLGGEQRWRHVEPREERQ
ncbi:unnamed protein product [Arctogadus glacialis]